MRNLVCTLFAALLATSATAADRIDDNGNLAFYLQGISSYTVDFHYSGQHSWIQDGMSVQDWAAPDCLILGGSMEPLVAFEAESFLRGIEVRDLMYDGAGGVVLPWTLHNGNYVYFLQGLSRYVDGIQVKTLDASRTFYQVMTDSFGDRQGNLALILSRGCRISHP